MTVHHDTEYEVHVFCPHCGSEDVTLEIEENGLFHFRSCNKCGYTVPPKRRFGTFQNA